MKSKKQTKKAKKPKSVIHGLDDIDNSVLEMTQRLRGKKEVKAIKERRHEAFLIEMELKTGNWVHFIAIPENERFEVNNKTYIIDDDCIFNNASFNMKSLRYHVDFTIPFKFSAPVSEIKEMMTNNKEIEVATNPSVIKRFLKSEVIQKIMQGEDYDATNFIKVGLIIVGILMFVNTVLSIMALV